MLSSFLHGLIALPGPGVRSNPDSSTGGGTLYRAQLVVGEYDMIPLLEEQYPGRVTYGPNPLYLMRGFIASTEFVEQIGSCTIFDVNGGLSVAGLRQYSVARVRDIIIDGVAQPDLILFQINGDAIPREQFDSIKINGIVTEGGKEFDLTDNPILPISSGGWSQAVYVTDGFDFDYIPDGAIVDISGEIVEGTDPGVPITAVPGPASEGHGLITANSGYVDRSGRLQLSMMPGSYLSRTNFAQAMQQMGSFVGQVLGLHTIDTSNNLVFWAGLDQFTTIATGCKGMAPAYAQANDGTGLYVQEAAIIYLKTDGSVNWWSQSGTPAGSEIDNIPAAIKTAGQNVRLVRTGMQRVNNVLGTGSDTYTGMCFAALTVSGDLFLWGKHFSSKGWPTLINLPGAVDVMIVPYLEPMILVQLDNGFVFRVTKDATVKVGQNVARMGRQSDGYAASTYLEYIDPDWKLTTGTIPVPGAGSTEVAQNARFISSTFVDQFGKMGQIVLDGFDSIVRYRWAEVKAPSDVTIFYPGRATYNTTTSPVPAKSRRILGREFGNGEFGFIDFQGRARQLDWYGNATRVACNSLATEGAVAVAQYTIRSTAILDVYGDVYDGGYYWEARWDKVSLWPDQKMKAIASFSNGGYPSINVVGLSLDNKLVAAPGAGYTIPAWLAGKTIRFLSNSFNLGGLVVITEEGACFVWDWFPTPATPSIASGVEATAIYPIRMYPLDPSTGLPSTTDGALVDTSVVRNPDGTVSELPRPGTAMTNMLVGANLGDVRRVCAGVNKGLCIQLQSNPRKLRYRSGQYNFVSGGPLIVYLTQWFDLPELDSVPLDWSVQDGTTGSGTSFFFSVVYLKPNGELWRYKATWPDITNSSSVVVEHVKVFDAGIVRTDIFTVGLPPVTGGWGLNWGNNFGG